MDCFFSRWDNSSDDYRTLKPSVNKTNPFYDLDKNTFLRYELILYLKRKNLESITVFGLVTQS